MRPPTVAMHSPSSLICHSPNNRPATAFTASLNFRTQSVAISSCAANLSHLVQLCHWQLFSIIQGTVAMRRRTLGRWIISLAVVLLFVVLCISRFHVKKNQLLSVNQISLDIPHSTDSSQTCVLPSLGVWGDDVVFEKRSAKNCSQNEPRWVLTNNSKLYLNPQIKQLHGKFKCHYRELIRVDDFKNEISSKKVRIVDGAKVTHDFMLIECTAADGATYTNLQQSIAPREFADPPERPSIGMDLSVIMIGFDSMSKLNMIRNLPKSHNYLVNTLGGIVLDGYNIVGDGTPAALLPILTGFLEEELPEARRGFAGAQPVDKHPWIWTEFAEAGAATLFTEEGPVYATFNYRMLGFNETPTHHYARPYMLALDSYDGNGFYRCFRDISRTTNLLNWNLEAAAAYRNRRKFFFSFFAELSHDALDWLQMADDDVLNFLKSLNDKRVLNRSIFILFADHGSRFSSSRATLRGRLEERLVYIGFVFPPWFARKFPEAFSNFQQNQKRLTTPYDIHETLTDVLRWKWGDGSPPPNEGRGISLFRSIPANRTCAEAGVPTHYCACLQWTPVDVQSNPMVMEAAQAVVDLLNAELTKTVPGLCEHMTVGQLLSASLLHYSPDLFRLSAFFNDVSDAKTREESFWLVTFKAKPSNAQFESTVKVLTQPKQVQADIKSISRLNEYGKEPHCMTDEFPYLRQFCKCISPPPS